MAALAAGQARLQREAAGDPAGGRRSHPGSGAAEKGPARRLRARHLPGRRPADLPQADRRRRDRRAGRRDGLHDRPRPRELAPRPGVLLQARRRADVRHGAVLPDRAGQPARPGRPRDRLDAHHLPRAARSPASRSTARRSRSRRPRTSPACWTSPAARWHDHHQLRRVGRTTCRASRSTARRARSACPTRTPSAGRCASGWRGDKEWRDVPLTHGYAENSRGLGVADMARAIREGRPHRASGELAYHVLDVMAAFEEASTAAATWRSPAARRGSRRCPRAEPRGRRLIVRPRTYPKCNYSAGLTRPTS